MEEDINDIYVYNIEWQIDNPEEFGLPREVTIYQYEEDEKIISGETDISQWLLENYNWTTSSFEYEYLEPSNDLSLK